MNLKTSLVGAVVVSSMSIYLVASAEERRGEEHARPERPAPPKFQAHPAGVHPHGATLRSHPVRVLASHVVARPGHEWNHWAHPEFARPAYYWDWGTIHSVSCIAEDSYGDQYPVTETAGAGFGMTNMTVIEDDALDRCYSESGQDPSCVLLSCSHF